VQKPERNRAGRNPHVVHCRVELMRWKRDEKAEVQKRPRGPLFPEDFDSYTEETLQRLRERRRALQSSVVHSGKN
jgi:hypothetical protein